MPPDNLHPTDRDLILAADGELSARRAAEVRAHLEACWPCRVRNGELQSAIADYLRRHRGGLDPQIPSPAGPRALLRSRMRADAANRAPVGPVRSLLPIAAALLFLFGGTALVYEQTGVRRATELVVPRRTVTPGETRAVSVSEVCVAMPPDGARNIPSSLRQKVFQEYGITNAGPNAYEVDYLITPELGGANSIRNLWPQPYSTEWNAHVKDMLEDRLHELVCSGQIDLATAQRDIATDWIGAYKKYFHTAKPL